MTRKSETSVPGIRTDEARANRSKISKDNWSKQEFKDKMSIKKIANWQNHEYREKQTESRKKSWNDPEKRARRMVGILAAAANPDVLAARKAGIQKVAKQVGETHKKLWEDPEYRAKQSVSRSVGQSARYAKPGAREAQAQRTKEVWARRKAAKLTFESQS